MDNDAPGALRSLLGNSPVMHELRAEILKYGPTDLRIHIHGETGTGKERVAQALHALSPRRAGQLVPFNAASFSDELVEAELFGHARGAFTGAVVSREGYVAQAEQGTLFLDEVAELTPRAQAKLLRFLDDGGYQRLGDTTPRRADVRVLSATNVDLVSRVREGRFREDLWYRLKDHQVQVPPLRERGEDVLFLARHFLRRGTPAEKPLPRLGAAALAALARHSWPGNVRQLENEMRRAAVAAAGDVVAPEHLSAEVGEARPSPGGDLRAARQEFERAHIRRVLERHGWVRTSAAAELGISRQALTVKIRRLGIDQEGPRRRPGPVRRRRNRG